MTPRFIIVVALLFALSAAASPSPRAPPMHFGHHGHRRDHDTIAGAAATGKPGHCDVRWFNQRIDHFSGFVPGSGALGANASAPTHFRQRYFWCDAHWSTEDGHAPRPGEIWRNANLAAVLRTIAEGGPEAFYGGDAGSAIVDVLGGLGGLMTADDLTSHTTTFDPPISTTYRGMKIYECSPNGQGLTVLIALNILEGFDLASMDRGSPEYWHTLIEAIRLAFADSRWYVADPSRVEVPVEQLLLSQYAASRRALIDPQQALPDLAHGEVGDAAGDGAGTDTVYLTAVDGDGNACSFINSNYAGFGTGIVPQGMGFSLQNRGANFSLDPAHPNALAGGKRPYHTIIPAMSTYEDGTLHASFGVKGGFMQPPGHVHMVVNMLDHGLGPQAALDAPRLSLRAGTAASPVSLETGIPVETMSALAVMGHHVVPSTDRFTFGTGHAIVRNPESGVLSGGADPRVDGAAIGY